MGDPFEEIGNKADPFDAIENKAQLQPGPGSRVILPERKQNEPTDNTARLCIKCSASARPMLEKLLGPATVVVKNGDASVYLYYQLKKPAESKKELAALELAREFMAKITGGDPSDVPPEQLSPELCRVISQNPDVTLNIIAALQILWKAATSGGAPHTKESEKPALQPDPARESDDWGALAAATSGGDPRNPTLTAALSLAKQRGWKTFPARMEDGKKYSWLSAEHAPEHENWGMTNDPKQLQRNFTNPKWRLKCGVGVPTGWVNRIFDVETDTPEGHNVDGEAALRKLEAEHGPLPDTLMAISPSGSKHRIYNHPGHGIKVISRGLPGYPGVDIKGDGGMFVAPPSMRKDGVYRWLNDKPIADAPQWLLDLVTASKSNGKGTDNGEGEATPRLKISKLFEGVELGNLGEGIEPFPPQPFPPIKAGCAWLRHVHDTNGADQSEILWRDSLRVCMFLENGESLIHELSKAYDGYDPKATEAKFARARKDKEANDFGWPLCETIQDHGCNHCETCPHLAADGSPLHLALRQEGPRKPAGVYTDYGADEPPLPEATVGLNSINAGHDDWNVDPRGWLLANIFCREYVSSLLGDGGVGKTALRYVQYLALATGKPLTGEHVFIRSRVLLISLEDGLNELRRRIKAACLHHNINQHELDGWLYYTALGAQDGKLMILDRRGKPIPGTLAASLEYEIVKTHADLVTLDPFVKTHGVEENNNSAIDEVVQILTDMAYKHYVAVDIPHHMAKGLADPGNANRGRGASAMKDAARLVYTLTAMTTDDAKVLGVDEGERRFLVRMDRGKVNIAPPATDTAWFRLVGVPLRNQNEIYLSGDTVQTIEPWKPPDILRDLSAPTIHKILDAIEAGLPNGDRYSDSAAARGRAAWPLIVEHCLGKTEGQAVQIIARWLKSGLLVRLDYTNKARQNAKGLYVDNSMRPA